jgi:hypothetical protein
MTYTVKEGEGINDVVLNSTGSIVNLDLILTANSFTDWSPKLTAGQILQIPLTVKFDYNTLNQLKVYPAANNLTDNIISKIVTLWNTIANYWILTTGFWNDSATWIDTDFWID